MKFTSTRKRNRKNSLMKELRKYIFSGKRYSARYGCGPIQFKLWIQSQFKDGMNWNNYGSGFGKWNFDHIIPLSEFDLNNPIQVDKAQHYTNIQPLWDYENVTKGNSVNRQLFLKLFSEKECGLN